jgi:hypothetical protein
MARTNRSCSGAERLGNECKGCFITKANSVPDV